MDTLPQLGLGQIRKLFLVAIGKYDHKADQFKDSCFQAEFGYFNLNFATSNATENLVKAWRITAKNSYPVAFYQDKDGKLISYDNGIRTFK